jgi:formamidopyrimidine-DNA glycosylase
MMRVTKSDAKTVPELPEVETVRRGLNQVTCQQAIQSGDVLLHRTVAYPDAAAFLAGMRGSTIVHWHRRGKYLLAELVQSNQSASTQSEILLPAGWLGVHLRMTGQLLWVDPAAPLQKHTRVRLFFASGKELRFVDQRTFGQLWWVPPDRPPESIITGLQHLGPEPFAAEFSVTYFEQQLRKSRRPVKNALLDQAIVAGIGNIYADEALFLSGIHPQTLGSELTRSQIERLHDQIVQVLQTSIEVKGTTFSTFRNLEGVNGNYGGIAWVYARDGEACRTCGTPIQRLRLAGRSAHFCPQCQVKM